MDKQWTSKPDFDRTPTRAPIKRLEAAQYLGRELLNRRDAGRFLERYGGRLTEMFVDLAGGLRDAACWRVSVGDYRLTADLLQEIAQATGGPDDPPPG